ncbi:MAG: NADP-dependent oxidoreductase [Caulobacteraceae bacterium]|nr:NADP-dependent oxidoreductase [Caulobacteraceae bacterium]
MPHTSREVHLVSRPEGLPKPTDFALVERAIKDPAEGQILVQNLYMSVDPYMRPRMTADFSLDAVMDGGALGRVVQSRNPRFKEGELVRNGFGFREYFLSDGRGVQGLEADPDLPLTVYMHALGGTGFTAYGGLLEIGQLKDEEQVFVSAAAGAVGSVAAQIARLRGCYVVGSAGSDEKCEWLRAEAGLDAALNYRAQPIAKSLSAVTPRGVDVYFDNVGGEHLDAALARINTLGRIAVCGMISGYNDGGAPVKGLAAIIYGRVTIRGFVATDFLAVHDRFVSDMTGWLKSGQIKYQETIVDGLEAAPEALIGLFKGANSGKMLVRLAA